MRLRVRELAPSAVLAGATAGSSLFGRLVSEVARHHSAEPSPLYVDFSGIQVATGSFLRESVLAFRGYCRDQRPDLPPVCANVSDHVREELEYLLHSVRDCVVVCQLDDADVPSDACVLGRLEPRQAATLKAVVQLGEVDASLLAERVDDNIGTTAWNNRLASLAAKHILLQIRDGRTKRFRTVLEGLTYGT